MMRTSQPHSPSMMFAEIRARAALGDTDGIQKVIDDSIKLVAQPGWTKGGLMRVTGEELIAHDKADAGHAILAKALHGERNEAEQISAQLEGMNLPYSFGSISAWQAQNAASLGNKDQAMLFLRRSASQGTRLDDWIHRRPAFKSLLDYPPFQDLLQPTG